MKVESKNLFNTDNLPAYLVIAAVFVLAIGATASIVKSGLLNIEYGNEQDILIKELSKSESGRFAVEKFYACIKSGTLLSKTPTSASCSVEVINSAKILHGEQYSLSVRDAVVKLDTLYSKYPD